MKNKLLVWKTLKSELFRIYLSFVNIVDGFEHSLKKFAYLTNFFRLDPRPHTPISSRSESQRRKSSPSRSQSPLLPQLSKLPHKGAPFFKLTCHSNKSKRKSGHFSFTCFHLFVASQDLLDRGDSSSIILKFPCLARISLRREISERISFWKDCCRSSSLKQHLVIGYVWRPNKLHMPALTFEYFNASRKLNFKAEQPSIVLGPPLTR